MERGLQGHYIQCSTSPEPFQAFIPSPLPPSPELILDANLCDWLERANRALGRLDGIATLLPETSLFLYLYVRKEAVLSSLKLKERNPPFPICCSTKPMKPLACPWMTYKKFLAT
jgi:Fic/DOC family N-terminal